MKLTVTTSEAAQLLGLNPHRFAEWARAADLVPLRRARIGRSTVTVWSIADIRAAQKRRYAGQVTSRGGEITSVAHCARRTP